MAEQTWHKKVLSHIYCAREGASQNKTNNNKVLKCVFPWSIMNYSVQGKEQKITGNATDKNQIRQEKAIKKKERHSKS